MDSSLTHLLVFNNTIQPELIRSVHVYGKGDEERECEREFLFSETGSYVEMQATPILQFIKSLVSHVREGYQNGVWYCFFAFHADQQPQFSRIPKSLLVTRNPKLKTIPKLLNDLRMIYQLDLKKEIEDKPQDSEGEERQGSSNDVPPPKKVFPVLNQDLNCLPYDEDESDESESPSDEINVESLPDKVRELADSVGKKKRANSDQVAKISLSDLVKYFDMPIVEASKNLNVGLTVLKRKCRELGIPRWPHRKIKSLDSLIQDLQEEAKHQELEDKAAAKAVAERQKMLESEKENIEKKPFMDIRKETKRFRQDVFKRRHRARAIGRQSSSSSTVSSA